MFGVAHARSLTFDLLAHSLSPYRSRTYLYHTHIHPPHALTHSQLRHVAYALPPPPQPQLSPPPSAHPTPPYPSRTSHARACARVARVRSHSLPPHVRVARPRFLAEVEAADNAKKAAAEAAQRAIEEKEAAAAAAAHAILNAVFEDKPFVARTYASETVGTTVEEVDELNVHNSRELITIHIMRRRKDFGREKHSKFNDRWAEDVGGEDFRQHKDPHFDLQRQQLDIGLQACASWTEPYLAIERANRLAAGVGQGAGAAGAAGAAGDETKGEAAAAAAAVDMDEGMDADTRLQGQHEEEVPRLVAAATQTTFFRTCNNSVQCTTADLAIAHEKQQAEDAAAAAAAEEEGGGNEGAGEAAKAGAHGGDVMSHEGFTDFLTKAGGFCEQALQQNEIVDIFTDEFSTLGDDDHSVGNKADSR